MAMNVWVGTAGYGYPDWVGEFYPAGLPAGRMLAFCARRFPFVELNFTFYRCPTADTLSRLAEQVPDDFRFAVKVPHSASHEQSFRDLAGFRSAVAALNGKLAGLVLQFPQSFHHSQSGRRWIELIGGELEQFPVGVEFRHWTWARPDVPGWLDERGMFLIAVDVPEVPALYPRGMVRSGRIAYVRLHSRRAETWHGHESDRYDYTFSDSALQGWVAALAREAGECDQAYVVFNNCRNTKAVANAERFVELVEEVPGLSVVPAHGAARPRQLSLF